jgi:hypothetical protein
MIPAGGGRYAVTRPSQATRTTSRAARAVPLLVLLAGPVSADDHSTPRAGEACTVSVFGKTIDVPARNRERVTELYTGLQWAPDAPGAETLSPAAALLVWRYPGSGTYRLRGEFILLYDDVRYNRRLAPAFDLVATFENTTYPWARSEFVEGRRLVSEELKWGTVRAGAGVAWRKAIRPLRPESVAEISLTYEAGGLFFSSGSDTGPGFKLPADVYEGRGHFRVRVDAFERNLLELPHSGWGAGLDAIAAHRAGWEDWGDGPSGFGRGADTASWSSIRGYALGAFPVPFVRGERHRLVLAGYAGSGSHLDRFSAFRLSGGSNAGDAETLARPVVPAAALDEIVTRGYALASLEYRFEALVFLFLSARGTLARVDRPRFLEDGSVGARAGWLNGVAVGLTSGFFWSTALEIFFERNFDLESVAGTGVTRGRSAFWFSFTKAF